MQVSVKSGSVRVSTSSLMEVGGRHRARFLMGSAVSKKGTTVRDGGDGLARSKGRRFSLCHLKMVSTSACA